MGLHNFSICQLVPCLISIEEDLQWSLSAPHFIHKDIVMKAFLWSFSFFLQTLRRSFSDQHLSPQMWGGWLNFEFSKIGGKHLGWAIKTIY